MKFFDIAGTTIQGLGIGLVLTVGVVYGLIHFDYISPVYPYVVMSGSMEPAIMTGSIVLVNPKDVDYAPGDVVTFDTGSGAVTHRIVEVEGAGSTVGYITQGDANRTPDQIAVMPEQIIGEAIMTVPYVGYVAGWAKTPHGFILMVIVPATIIIYEELKLVWRELRKLGRWLRGRLSVKRSFWNPGGNRDDRVLNSSDPIASLQDDNSPILPNTPRLVHPVESNFAKLTGISVSLNDANTEEPAKIVRATVDGTSKTSFALIPVTAALVVAVGVTGSYFTSSVASSGNVLGVQVWDAPVDDQGDDPPIPANTIVINEVLPASSCSVGQTQGLFIELINMSNGVVNLQDHSLSNGEEVVGIIHAGNVNLQPGQMALLVLSTAIVNQCLGEITQDTPIINLTGSFDLTIPSLFLHGPENVIIDALMWGEEWSLEPETDESLERIEPGWDTAFGNQFEPGDFLVRQEPTPGE